MQRFAVCYHAWRSEVHLGISEEVGRVRYWACIFSAHVRENIMTRISTLFVVIATLATLALFASIAGAAQKGSQTPQQTPRETGKPPANQPTGSKNFGWSVKPKAVNSS